MNLLGTKCNVNSSDLTLPEVDVVDMLSNTDRELNFYSAGRLLEEAQHQQLYLFISRQITILH